MSQWTTEPIFNSLGLIGLVAIVIALITVFIPPHSANLSTSRVRILMGLRLAAGLILMVAMLRPTHITTDNQPAPATLAILLDGSRSMTLPAGGDQTRWQIQRDVWQRIAPIIAGVDDTLQVAVAIFDKDLKFIEGEHEAVEAILNGEPIGDATDLAAALRGVITRAGSTPLAGVVMVSDGTQTVSRSKGPQTLAQTLAALEVPLWTIPIGPPQDASAARDIAIDGLADEFSVFAKNVFKVTASLTAKGLDNKPVTVRLTLTDSGGNTREIAEREIVISTADDQQVISIESPAPEAGDYRMDLIADPQEGEILTGNNRQSAFLNVREGGGKVLYLEGEPRPEQLFLRRSVGASPDFELAFQWIERDRTGTGWPVDLGLAFAADRHDIFILGDLDASALGRQQLEDLRARIQAGAGLLMIGGFHSFDAGGYGTSPLADVLPIKMSSRRQTLDQPIDPAFHLEGEQRVRVARDHPLTRLFDAENQQTQWNELRPLNGANRLGEPKPIPGVEVLLETDNAEPLLVIGAYGQGRVAAFAGDSTWEWWRQGRQEAHRRFWRQLLLWLIRRDTMPEDQIALEIERRRFPGDKKIEFVASIRRDDAASIDADLKFEAIDSSGTTFELPADLAEGPTASGAATAKTVRWAGTIEGLPDGFYRLRARDTADGSQIQAAELAFQVVSIDRELSRPVADIAQMQQLALVTAPAGGKPIPVEDVESLRDVIDQHRRQAATPIVSKWRFGEDSTSGWITLFLFAALLTGDWTLRKLWGLV